MSKMSRMMLDSMDRFILEAAINGNGRNGGSAHRDGRKGPFEETADYAAAGQYN
jgi:hypothetical protein